MFFNIIIDNTRLLSLLPTELIAYVRLRNVIQYFLPTLGLLQIFHNNIFRYYTYTRILADPAIFLPVIIIIFLNVSVFYVFSLNFIQTMTNIKRELYDSLQSSISYANIHFRLINFYLRIYMINSAENGLCWFWRSWYIGVQMIKYTWYFCNFNFRHIRRYSRTFIEFPL